MQTNTGRLILTPVDPYISIDEGELLAVLQDSGLIGDSLDESEHSYRAGDRFMQVITFAGCSPYLRFEANDPEDNDFCHIRLTLVEQEQPHCLHGVNTRPPTCPHCRQALREWQQAIESWDRDGSPWQCPKCGHSVDLPRMNWRKHAGFGRTLVEVFSVFPGEAVPVTSLLENLAKRLNVDWTFFYVQSPVQR